MEKDMRIIRISEHPDMRDAAAEWFSKKWGIPTSAYLESMDECIAHRRAVPQWYIATRESEIVGGMGVIDNDFHPRTDLAPNVCAVFVEPQYRGRGIARELLRCITQDMSEAGIGALYLLTDHTGLYERYGWEFFCHVCANGEESPSRMYRKILTHAVQQEKKDPKKPKEC